MEPFPTAPRAPYLQQPRTQPRAAPDSVIDELLTARRSGGVTILREEE